MRKKNYVALTLAAALLLSGCGNQKTQDTAAATEAATAAETEAATEAASEEGTETQAEADTEDTASSADAEPAGFEAMSYVTDEYKLVWDEEFNDYEGELSKDDWNYEAHQVGWVNSELQKYVASSDYAYVKDGELIIQPVKNEDGSYVSGRVNTSGKHDFTYGIFEARIKVPEGKGFLPAFWMMPTDENLYGQRPDT